MPAWSRVPPVARRLGRYWWVAGLAIAAVIVIVLAPLASPDPDGLERVAQDNGFLANAQSTLYSIIPDYTVPGIDGNTSTILAGPDRDRHRVRGDAAARADPRPPQGLRVRPWTSIATSPARARSTAPTPG